MKHEKVNQVIEIAITMILFILGCVVGKIVMNIYDTWISFNGPAIGIVLIGELLWWMLRRVIKTSGKKTNM